jgi:hypothetical protein
LRRPSQTPESYRVLVYRTGVFPIATFAVMIRAIFLAVRQFS